MSNISNYKFFDTKIKKKPKDIIQTNDDNNDLNNYIKKTELQSLNLFRNFTKRNDSYTEDTSTPIKVDNQDDIGIFLNTYIKNEQFNNNIQLNNHTSKGYGIQMNIIDPINTNPYTGDYIKVNETEHEYINETNKNNYDHDTFTIIPTYDKEKQNESDTNYPFKLSFLETNHRKNIDGTGESNNDADKEILFLNKYKANFKTNIYQNANFNANIEHLHTKNLKSNDDTNLQIQSNVDIFTHLYKLNPMTNVDRNNPNYIPHIGDIQNLFFQVGSTTLYMGNKIQIIEYTATGPIMCIPNTGWIICNGATISPTTNILKRLYDFLVSIINTTSSGEIQLPNIMFKNPSETGSSDSSNPLIRFAIFSGNSILRATLNQFANNGVLRYFYKNNNLDYSYIGYGLTMNTKEDTESHSKSLYSIGTTSFNNPNGNISFITNDRQGLLNNLNHHYIEHDDNTSSYFANNIIYIKHSNGIGRLICSGFSLDENDTKESYLLYVVDPNALNENVESKLEHDNYIYFKNENITSVVPVEASEGQEMYDVSYIPHFYLDKTKWRDIIGLNVPSEILNIVSSLEMAHVERYISSTDYHHRLITTNLFISENNSLNVILRSFKLQNKLFQADIFGERTKQIDVASKFTNNFCDISASVLDFSLNSFVNQDDFVIPFDVSIEKYYSKLLDEGFTNQNNFYVGGMHIPNNKTKDINRISKLISRIRAFNIDKCELDTDSSFNTNIRKLDIDNAVITAVNCNDKYVYYAGVILPNSSETTENTDIGDSFICKVDKSGNYVDMDTENIHSYIRYGNNIDISLCRILKVDYNKNSVTGDNDQYINTDRYDLITNIEIDVYDNVYFSGIVSDITNKSENKIVLYKFNDNGKPHTSFGDTDIIDNPYVQFMKKDDYTNGSINTIKIRQDGIDGSYNLIFNDISYSRYENIGFSEVGLYHFDVSLNNDGNTNFSFGIKNVFATSEYINISYNNTPNRENREDGIDYLYFSSDSSFVIDVKSLDQTSIPFDISGTVNETNIVDTKSFVFTELTEVNIGSGRKEIIMSDHSDIDNYVVTKILTDKLNQLYIHGFLYKGEKDSKIETFVIKLKENGDFFTTESINLDDYNTVDNIQYLEYQIDHYYNIRNLKKEVEITISKINTLETDTINDLEKKINDKNQTILNLETDISELKNNINHINNILENNNLS
jgi:hypothetical protein